MKDKFLLRIPLDETDLSKGYEEFKFKTYVEIGEYLNIKPHLARSLAEGKAKFVRENTKFLQHIRIEKLYEEKEYSIPKTEEETREYLQKIRERVREAKAKNQQVSENSLNEL